MTLRGTASQRAGASALAIGALLGSPACKSEPAPPRNVDAARSASFLRHYADLAAAVYGDSVSGAKRLLEAARALAVSPSRETLEGARSAWKAARVPYAQTEGYRFYGGPIDTVEKGVNTWPIDEEYIESSDGKASLVTDATKYPALSKALLASLNMKDGETSVTTGFHAIEFLLWGKDTLESGPGDRDASAFDPKTKLGARRAEYLVSAAELLVEHLTQVAAGWTDGRSDNYRATFLRLPRQSALGLVVKGVGALSGPELSGERLTVAYETRDQENEHSCFSDNTSVDLAENALGVQNVCLGHYTSPTGEAVSGPGLCDLVGEVDPALGARLKTDIAHGVATTRALPSPFDRALVGPDSEPGRQAIAAAITALSTQADTLKLAAAALNPAASLASANR